ncbi:integrase catalytic domain-containing protein [Trichonephila clavipes]|nr:integrase catalytic domain-containing protein [Trichonephila clavipes]
MSGRYVSNLALDEETEGLQEFLEINTPILRYVLQMIKTAREEETSEIKNAACGMLSKLTDGLMKTSSGISVHLQHEDMVIGSIKQILRKYLGRAGVTYEQMLTLLCEGGSVLHERPLSYVSDDLNEMAAVTPAHFIQDIR